MINSALKDQPDSRFGNKYASFNRQASPTNKASPVRQSPAANVKGNAYKPLNYSQKKLQEQNSAKKQ